MSLSNNGATLENELDLIRQVLLDKTNKRIEELGDAIHDEARFTTRVAQAIPEVFNPPNVDEKQLAFQMQSNILNTLQVLGKDQPDNLAKSLAPAIGPAISSAILTALTEFRQTMERLMRDYLSPRGLMWRIESWRSGESFRQIALRRTQGFGVDGVVLIHKKTSEILHQEYYTEESSRFAENNTQALHGFWLELTQEPVLTGKIEQIIPFDIPIVDVKHQAMVLHGPWLTMVCTCWGKIPDGEKAKLLRIHQGMHQRFNRALQNHQMGSLGLTGIGSAAQAVFEPDEVQLASEVSQEPKSKVPWFTIISVLVLLALSFWQWQRYQQKTLREFLHDDLNAQPGVMVKAVKQQSAFWQVQAMADPALFKPELYRTKTLQTHPSLGDIHFDLQPILSLQPAAVESRAKETLQPPANFKILVDDRLMMHVLGNAEPSNQAWLDSLPTAWPRVLGASGVSTTGVKTATEPSK
jgi:hypothetical protein